MIIFITRSNVKSLIELLTLKDWQHCLLSNINKIYYASIVPLPVKNFSQNVMYKEANNIIVINKTKNHPIFFFFCIL